MRISDWSSDVCSSDLLRAPRILLPEGKPEMSNTTLRNALVLSVLVNVGVLAGLGWQKLSRDGLPMPSGAPTELSRELQLSASQLQRSEARRVGLECVSLG